MSYTCDRVLSVMAKGTVTAARLLALQSDLPLTSRGFSVAFTMRKHMWTKRYPAQRDAMGIYL